MKKVIEQPGIVNLNIQVSTNDDLDVILSQSNNFTHDEIRIIKSKSREVALSISPELESELKEAVELIEEMVKQTEIHFPILAESGYYKSHEKRKAFLTKHKSK